MALKGLGLDRLLRRNREETRQESRGTGVGSAGLARARPPEGTTILIVDDAKTIHFMLSRTLGNAGYQTLSAFDGESGVAMARENKPALILMDVVMPGMTGYQATRAIRKDDDPAVAQIPVLIISGNALPTEEMWSSKVGANGFMAKPFDNDALFARIEALLGLGAGEPGSPLSVNP